MFPNGIFELPPMRNFSDPDHLTLFFGALNRGADWAPLMPALNEVARAVGDRLRFHVLYDEAFFNALETPHKRFDPMADYASYMRMLGEADIALMPLEDTEFNRSKSDLKFIEASSARVASLASNVVYGDTIQNGKTGLIFRDAMELRAGLLRLLAYPEATRKIADAARAYVARERMLAYQVTARTEWYRSLWERRDALNAGPETAGTGAFRLMTVPQKIRIAEHIEIEWLGEDSRNGGLPELRGDGAGPAISWNRLSAARCYAPVRAADLPALHCTLRR